MSEEIEQTELEKCKMLLEQREAELALLQEQLSHSEIYEKNYIDTNEVAMLLRLRPRTIRAYNYNGTLTGRKYTKEGRLYFPLKQVLELRAKKLRHWAAFD